MVTIDTGSDFSGVGAFDQALERLGIKQNKIFSCDMDKYARQTYVLNYGEPAYFPKDVYEREIPKKPLGIYMTSPPCQGFSIAGKREGSILFLNSHEFIKVNKPRYFIFENVKGLLSHEKDKKNKKALYGKTFNEWLNYLGGKSVNGNPVMFPHEESVPYHIYHKVLNAKKYGVPQNRERVFIVGIRNDSDNNFHWPKEEYLKIKLKDVLEENVNEKYFLSDKMINYLISNQDNRAQKFLEGTEENVNCITATYSKMPTDGQYLKIKSNTKKGYDIAKDGDSINFAFPKNETKRGRVGKGVSQTIDTLCTQSVFIADYRTDEGLRIRKNGISPCMTASMRENTETMKRGNCVPFVGYDSKIRRLTPRECFRLMDFPDQFKWNVSDTQAYKQAGNSIVVGVLEKIIRKLNLK